MNFFEKILNIENMADKRSFSTVWIPILLQKKQRLTTGYNRNHNGT